MNKLDELCDLINCRLEAFYIDGFCDGEELTIKYKPFVCNDGYGEVMISLAVVRKDASVDELVYDISNIDIDSHSNVESVCEEIYDIVDGWFSSKELMSEIED